MKVKKFCLLAYQKNETPFGNYQYSDAFFDFMKTWIKSSNDSKISSIDWRMWLPRTFYLNWCDPTWQKSLSDPTIWLPMAYYPQEERECILKIYNIAGDFVAGNKSLGDYVEQDSINKTIENLVNKEVTIMNNTDNDFDDRPFINVGGDYVVRSKVGGDNVEQGSINKTIYSLQGDGIILGNNNEVTKSIQNIDPQFKESII